MMGQCTVELRADDSGVERRILATLSENNEHDIIAQMAFAFHLILRVRNTQGRGRSNGTPVALPAEDRQENTAATLTRET
jgi:hypothetical protein